MKKILFNVLSLLVIFTFVACDDDDETPEYKPELKIEAVSSAKEELTFNFKTEHADKIAYSWQTESEVPSAEDIISQNHFANIDTENITINNLETEKEYYIFAVAINEANVKFKYSEVVSLKMKTELGIKFNLVTSQQFGCNVETLKSEQEKLGYNVGNFDDATRTIEVNTNDTYQKKIKYYFNSDNQYMYSLISLNLPTEGISIEDFLIVIEKDGWKEYKKGTEYEYLFTKDNLLMRFFTKASEAQKTPALLIGKLDESLLSWTRTDILKDEATGMFTPLAAIGCSLDLIKKYEFYQGHKVNDKRTNPRAQFYAFDTGDEKFPMIGYWMDIQTNTFLDQCALYIDKSAIPTKEEMDRYIRQFGYEPTPLTDGYMNPIYYKKDVHGVCCAETNQPQTGEDYAPKLRFYTEDLTSTLPKEKVNIPWPNTEFGKITMQEAIDWYKAKGYTVDPKGFYEVFPLVKTDSEDFPSIVLMPADDDENIYYAASVLTEAQNVITSPDIVKQFKERGYHQVENSTLPTFVNEKINVSAQIDLSGMFGPFSIGFNPIGG